MQIRKYIMFLTFIFLLAACTVDDKKNNETEWQDGAGELSDKITQSEELPQLVIDHYYDDYMDVIEKSKLDAPTSKWFLHDDEGKFGYGLPSGTMEKGAPYKITLLAHDTEAVKVNRDLRIRLKSWKNDKIIQEQTIHIDKVSQEELIAEGTLPDEENIVYTLSLEFLNEQGEVEDTMASMVYVPAPEINASLSIKEGVITLKNDGPTFLVIGEAYTIEKKINGKWKIVPLELAFQEIGIIISPGDQYEQEMRYDNLTPGEYRVIKGLHADGLQLSARLAATFTIGP